MPLTHWARVTHIWVSKLTIIGSDSGLSPGRRQASLWTNAWILSIGPLGTNFGEILTEIRIFLFRKMHLKMSSAKWWLFCLGLNVLNSTWLFNISTGQGFHTWIVNVKYLAYQLPSNMYMCGHTDVPNLKLICKTWLKFAKHEFSWNVSFDEIYKLLVQDLASTASLLNCIFKSPNDFWNDSYFTLRNKSRAQERRRQ